MRKLEILIVVAALLVVAFVFGCKDEAEAFTVTAMSDSNEPIQWGESIFLEVILKDEPTFEDGETRIYLYKGDDFDVVIEKKEPNEPEPEILICREHHKRYCKICESIIYKAGWLLPFKGSYLYNQALQEKREPEPEPNEPEATSSWAYIADLNEPRKVSLDFIPTWPDYIELEKELRIAFPDNKTMSAGWWFPKGTKIYFKDKGEN